jgi:hypothetical protein
MKYDVVAGLPLQLSWWGQVTETGCELFNIELVWGDLDYWATYKSYEKLIKNTLLEQKEKRRNNKRKLRHRKMTKEGQRKAGKQPQEEQRSKEEEKKRK